MGVEIIHALEQLEREKGIDKDVLVEAIEIALISAYKRNFGDTQDVRIGIDKETGDIRVFSRQRVAQEPNPDLSEISVEQAKETDPALEEGDVLETEVTPRKFGRIAAQTAKQVVVQRIREAERDLIFDMYASREDDIVTGIVNRFERKNVILDIGKAEAVLPEKEQAFREDYRYNDRVKAYITEVRKMPKGPQVMVSRTHPGLVRRLFELEVPEISDGIVEIMSIAREAGSRTKIAVSSRDDNVDPVGACVGQRGTRVQAIVDELRGEKIDIIKWSQNPVEFLSSSLSPAKVVRVDLSLDDRVAGITVPDFQLSLAIGKEGQNARLAAKLTGWKIDIRSETQLRDAIARQLLNYDKDLELSDEDDLDDESDFGEFGDAGEETDEFGGADEGVDAGSESDGADEDGGSETDSADGGGETETDGAGGVDGADAGPDGLDYGGGIDHDRVEGGARDVMDGGLTGK